MKKVKKFWKSTFLSLFFSVVFALSVIAFSGCGCANAKGYGNGSFFKWKNEDNFDNGTF